MTSNTTSSAADEVEPTVDETVHLSKIQNQQLEDQVPRLQQEVMSAAKEYPAADHCSHKLDN